MGHLKQDVAWAKAAGVKVSINLQNYGRYTINHVTCVIDNPCNGTVQVTGAHLADFWMKMAAVFKDDDTVFAYDMMNEPHDMGVANWNQISQQVVNAIRTVDSRKLIMVPGNQWSNATNWASINGATSWISDPRATSGTKATSTSITTTAAATRGATTRNWPRTPTWPTSASLAGSVHAVVRH